MLIFILLFVAEVFAAPMPAKPVDVLMHKKVREIVSSDGDIPVVDLQSLSPTKKEALQAIAFNDNEEMRVRWRALVALAKTEKAAAKEDLSKAFHSKVWYMRNGALLASPYAGKKWSQKWAKYLFEKDEALLVRMAALDLIAQEKKDENAKLLWEKLDSPKNFHNGQSLMIRGRIMKALETWGFAQDKAKFKKYVSDADEVVREHAALALKRL